MAVNTANAKSTATHGISECHELKIIEILSWILGALNIVITVPIVMGAMRKRKDRMRRRNNNPGGMAEKGDGPGLLNKVPGIPHAGGHRA